MSNKILLGTYTRRDSKGIYSVELNTSSKSLENLTLEAEVGSPTYLDTNKDASEIYAVLKEGEDQGGVVYLKKDTNEEYQIMDTSTAEGAAPCYVAYDEDRNLLYSANYHDGKVGLYKVSDDSITLVDEVQHFGKSVHENQDAPHAHYFDLSPDRNYLIACDLGTDEVLTYQANEEEKIVEIDRISVVPGTGPRHIAFHPNGKFVYLFGELSSDVVVFQFNPENGTLSTLQTISTIPSDFNSFNGGAAIRVSSDGQFVYASNRGHDSLAVFKIDDEYKLELVEFTPTEGETPRDFNLDPSDQFVVVAHQDTDNLSLFERDETTGKLTLLQKDVYAPEVVCVKFV